MNERFIAFCALVAMLSAGEPARPAEAPRVELPGFSIVLPAGNVVEQSKLPAAGTYKLAYPGDVQLGAPYDKLNRESLLPGGRQVALSWMATAHTPEEWRSYVEAIARSMGMPAKVGREEKIADGRQVTMIDLPEFSIGIGSAICEGKFSVIVIWALSRDRNQQWLGTQTAVESVQCKLTPENMRPFEAVITLPRGFEREPSPEGQIYSSDSGEELVVSYTSQDVQKHGAKLREIIANLFAVAGEFRDAKLTDVAIKQVPGRPESLFRFVSPDLPRSAFVGALYCPPFDVTFISIWTGPEPTEELALKRVRAVACPPENSIGD